MQNERPTAQHATSVTAEEVLEIRAARGAVERERAAEAWGRLPAAPGAAQGSPRYGPADGRRLVVAARGDEIVGVSGWSAGAGHCASILLPRLERWDEETAARLVAEAVRGAAAGARLIQALAEPDESSALAHVLQRAGMARLAVLAYLRRKVAAADAHLAASPSIALRRRAPWRRGKFARTIERTYEGSLDCPAMAGLRTVRDAIATHRATGLFRPWAWHLALEEREAVGVVLTSAVEGRGDLTYLGVVPQARQRGIGRALLAQAIRDTARMGLPVLGLAVDVSNTPAVRLYAGAGFQEVRRRLVWFVPRERLESPGFTPAAP